MEAKPWNSDLLFIKRAIETASKTIYNSVLINYYRDGKDRVAWHSDDEKELGKNPVIGPLALEPKGNSNFDISNTNKMATNTKSS